MPIDAKAFIDDLRTLGAGIRNAASQALSAALQDAEADA